MRRPWIVFYSHTGKEISELISKTGQVPDLILTNLQDLAGVDPFIAEMSIKTTNRPSPEEYELLLSGYENPLITLHGWMRIIPPSICQTYEVWNGHPALIHWYPELKGANPVDRTWENLHKYRTVGSVVHKVTEGVDEGEVVTFEEVKIPEGITISKNDLYTLHRKTSLKAWEKFFNLLEKSK